MEMSSPLRWLGAIAAMIIVVVIAVPMLIRTVGETVQLSTEASEDVTAAAEDATATEGAVAEGEFPQTYTVQDGDTGEDISERFYGNPDGWERIAEANDIDPDNPPQVDEELEIPAPEGEDEGGGGDEGGDEEEE